MPTGMFLTSILMVLMILTSVLFIVYQPTSDREPGVLPAVSDWMRAFVANKEIAGAVTLVATRDKIVHLEATGLADMTTGMQMQPDSLFWIASMTKPVTAAAVLMLQDQGKLSVEDPVAKYIPELAHLKTSDGKPAKIQIRQLLTHTSGMGEISAEQAKMAKTLADLIPLCAAQPLKFEPGTQWTYCQSGINTAARIVEIVSGRSFPEFLEQHLFRPLGMKDTTFTLTPQQLPRLAKSYRKTEDGRLEETEIGLLHGKSPTSRDRFPAANGGLFSTAPDYARFCQMLLNEGTLDGKRVLTPEAVEQMKTIQTGNLKTGFTEGNGWGLGCCVVRQPQGVTAVLSPGSYGHGGAYGTQAWIDPVKGVIYLLMVQRANFPNSDASNVRQEFQKAAASALEH